MKDKITFLDIPTWREKRAHPCQALCEGNIWWLKRHGKYPPCKHFAMYGYKGKEYCSLHMGHLLIKERMER